MVWLNRTYIAAVSAVVSLGVPTLAEAQDAEPVAYVTVVSGSGATRGESGPAFPREPGAFSDALSGLATGESVKTLDGGAAALALPDYGITVHLEESSELLLKALPVLDNAVPVSLTLIKGRAYVVQRQGDVRWLLVAGDCDAGRGYTMSKGASLAVSVDSTGIAFAAVWGDVLFFDGDVPAGALVKETGELVDTSGVSVPEGHHISTQRELKPAPEIPDALSGSAARSWLSDALYGFGLHAGEKWVERAERGDFIPVRGVARGAPEMFAPEGLAPELTFDQPRQAVVAPAPRAGMQPTRVQALSPVRALLETRRPTSVVVGARLARTRIIGSPGTSPGPIRVNPYVEPLIRLPRR